MADFIEKKALLRALERTVYKTYYKEIVKKTPGKGIVADGWEVFIEGGEVILGNREFGQIIKFLEDGTDPHIIRAKPGKVLRWKIGPGDTYAFAKAVKHPGIVAMKFVSKALENPGLYKKYLIILEKEIKKVLPAKLNIS